MKLCSVLGSITGRRAGARRARRANSELRAPRLLPQGSELDRLQTAEPCEAPCAPSAASAGTGRHGGRIPRGREPQKGPKYKGLLQIVGFCLSCNYCITRWVPTAYPCGSGCDCFRDRRATLFLETARLLKLQTTGNKENNIRQSWPTKGPKLKIMPIGPYVSIR